MKQSLVKLLYFFLPFTVLSCIKQVEGCLDTEATNYNVSADKNCCCNKPQLVLNINYLANGEPFNSTAIHEDIAGNSYQINRIAFYISEAGLGSEDTFYIADDSLLIYSEQIGQPIDSSLFHSNISLVNRTGFNLSLGDFLPKGDFESLRFRFGLPEIVNNHLYEKYRRGHPLFIQSDSMHTFTQGNGYIFFKVEINLTETSQSRIITISGNENSSWIELFYPYTSIRGEDRRLSVQIDLLRFLEGIDWINDSDEVIQDKILTNIPNVFWI